MKGQYFIGLAMLLAGCGQLPNPNDLETIVAENRASIAYERLLSAESTLQYKVAGKEITDAKRNQLIAELSNDMLQKIDIETVPAADQWKYASLLRVTNRWEQTEKALDEAVKVAKTPDRKVNDTLKLAQAEAHNGNVEKAIQTASTVLDVDDKDAAPILPSVLYEIVPAAENKGHNKELADLLQKAMACHMRVKVDQNTDEGKLFIYTMRHHMGKAQEKLNELLKTP